MMPPANQLNRKPQAPGRLLAACLVGLLLATSALGCLGQIEPPLSDVGPLGSGEPAPPATGPQTAAVSLFDLTPAEIAPTWTLEYDRPVSAALAADGGHVLIGRSYGSVRNSTQWSAMLYDATGEELWRQDYQQVRYRTIEIELLGPEPIISSALFASRNSGTLYVSGLDGAIGWERSVDSSVCLASDAAGERIYGIDRGRSQAFVVNARTGRELATIAVADGASLQVAPGGEALVVSSRRLILLSRDGRVRARVPVNQDFTMIALSPGGDAVYAVTGGADSSAYRLDTAGQVVWRQELAAGGSNAIAVGPNADLILAYNVGVENSFVLLDARDGTIVRRNELAPVENAKDQFVRGVKFLPEGAGLLLDYCVAYDRTTGHAEEHSLLYFDAEGNFAARLDLGRNVNVLTSEDGQACVVVTTAPLAGAGPSTNKVQLYNLRPLFGQE